MDLALGDINIHRSEFFTAEFEMKKKKMRFNVGGSLPGELQRDVN